MKNAKTKNNQQVTGEEAQRAFERIRPRLDALDANALVRPNFSISRAAVVVLAAEPRIAELIPEMKKRLRDFPVELVNDLRELALGALYAQAGQVQEMQKEEKAVADLVAEARVLRATFRQEAEVLSARKLLPPE